MQTIQKDCRTEIVIEKSRFICTLKKVSSEAEAQEFIKSTKRNFGTLRTTALPIL